MALSFGFRSSIRALLAACLLAAATVAVSLDRATGVICVAVWRAWRFTIDLIFKPLARLAVRWKNLPGPAVALLAARQFYQRQVKRDRPRLEPQWRSCAST